MNAADLHLNPACLRSIREILERHVPDLTVWAYGSRLGGGHHAGSDLDLVLLSPDVAAIPGERLGVLREALSESEIPILVDLHDWARLPAAFQEEIRRNHHVLQVAHNRT